MENSVKEWVKRYALFAFCTLSSVTSCSRPGINDETTPPPPAEPQSSDNVVQRDENSTQVAFTALDKAKLKTITCREGLKDIAFALSQPATVDGDFSEWNEKNYFFDDRNGDGALNGDLQRTFLGTIDNDVFLALQMKAPTDPWHLYIEVGGLVLDKNNAFFEQGIRFIRLNHNGAEWWSEDAWQPLTDGQLISWKWGVGGLELKLNRLLMGEVLTYPAWWLRTSLRNGDGGFLDGASIQYFPTTAESGEKKFVMRSCSTVRPSGKVSHHIEIRDAAISEETAEEVFGLSRQAFSLLKTYLGEEELPYSDVAVIATAHGRHAAPKFFDQEKAVSANNAARVDAAEAKGDAAEFASRESVFQSILRQFLNNNLLHAQPLLADSFRESVLIGSLKESIVVEMGKAFWLLSYWSHVNPLWVVGEENADQLEWAKAEGFGEQLGRLVSRGDLLATWMTGEKHTSAEAFINKLTERLNPESKAKLLLLVNGWLNDKPFEADYHPDILKDGDEDGLPNFLEIELKSAINERDTDGDGWTDLAEWIHDTNSANNFSHPSVIVPDSNLGDWRDLIPSKIKSDPDKPTIECADAGNILYFTALANKDQMLIAAELENAFSEDIPVSWEVMVDLPTAGQRFLLTVVSGEKTYKVLRGKDGAVLKVHTLPQTLGKNVLELMIDAKALGVRQDLSDTDGINLRLTTVLERNSKHFCDDTPWFRPLKSLGSYN